MVRLPACTNGNGTAKATIQSSCMREICQTLLFIFGKKETHLFLVNIYQDVNNCCYELSTDSEESRNSQLTAAMGRVLVMAPESKESITVILFISDSWTMTYPTCQHCPCLWAGRHRGRLDIPGTSSGQVFWVRSRGIELQKKDAPRSTLRISFFEAISAVNAFWIEQLYGVSSLMLRRGEALG